MNRMIYINTCQISLSFTELCCQHICNKENQIWGLMLRYVDISPDLHPELFLVLKDVIFIVLVSVGCMESVHLRNGG